MSKSDFAKGNKCPVCDTPISNRAKFCKTHFMWDKPHESRKKETYTFGKKCLDCGKPITNHATRCDSCNGVHRRTIFGKKMYTKGKLCLDCGKPISNRAVKCRSCSKIGTERLDMRGERNPKWTGGWLPYYGPNWDSQRKRVFERDKGLCSLCGGQTKQMDVHHQIPFSKSINYLEANSFANLVTVCQKCHRILEKQEISKIENFISLSDDFS